MLTLSKKDKQVPIKQNKFSLRDKVSCPYKWINFTPIQKSSAIELGNELERMRPETPSKSRQMGCPFLIECHFQTNGPKINRLALNA